MKRFAMALALHVCAVNFDLRGRYADWRPFLAL
jgi:hypothetical protein